MMKSESNPTLFGAERGTDGHILALGLPFDQGATSQYGCALAPHLLRKKSAYLNIKQGFAYHTGSRKKVMENLSLSDIGDLPYDAILGHDRYFAQVRTALEAIFRRGKKVMVLGGDHLMTLPVLEALGKAVPAFQVIQLDAHTDYHRVESGELPTHANFVHFVAKIPACKKVVQIGVRALSRELPEVSPKVVSIDLETLSQTLIPNIPIYLSVDTDAFDPSIAPGVGHPVVNGLQWKDLTAVLKAIEVSGADFIGADWMEYNPHFDAKNHLTSQGVLFGLSQIVSTLNLHQIRKGNEDAA